MTQDVVELAGAPALPPDELMMKVVGNASPKFFVSGVGAVEVLLGAMERAGGAVPPSPAVLDFGCGPGRLIPAFNQAFPDGSVVGVDIDREAIGWASDAMDRNEFHVIDPLPPMPLDCLRFDLVIGLSVLTHLDENYQDAWLAELLRVTRRGGCVLLTVHLEQHFHKIAGEQMSEDVRKSITEEYEREGFAFWSGDRWSEQFPSYYHTSFHTPDYIRNHWSRWFDVLGIFDESNPKMHHGIAVLRAPD